MIAAIGTNWEPGAWQCVIDMMGYAQQQEYNVCFEEVPDPMIGLPYSALENMRDVAVEMAKARGVEWLCMVDNDVLPQPDLLVRLIERDRPIIGPWVIDPQHPEQSIGYPSWPRSNGLRPMRFIPFSFMLFRMSVFNCFAAPFAGVVTEGTLFLRFWNYGHRTVQDTDNALMVAKPPSYRAESYNDYWERMARADKKRRLPPDRHPILPDTPSVRGMYAPWWTNGHAGNSNAGDPAGRTRLYAPGDEPASAGLQG